MSQKRKLAGDDAAGPSAAAAAVAHPAAAAFAGRLQELTALSCSCRTDWVEALARVHRAATLTDDALHSEGRCEAARRYPLPGQVPHLWPEPPSVRAMIELSVRTASEEALASSLDNFCADVAAAKAAALVRITAAKEASPSQPEVVRELGRGINALFAVIKAAKLLDAPARERLQLTTLRIARYRASRAVRELTPRARLERVPPTRSGYEQVLDFYRLTEASIHSFGRAEGGPQFFTDVRRNVAVLHATRGPSAAEAEAEAEAGVVFTPSATAAADDDDAAEEAQEEGEAGRPFFSAYSVSGVDAPGLRPSYTAARGAGAGGGEGDAAPSPPLFTAIECEDGLGECYLRDQDAEYKLVSEFCARRLGLTSRGQVCDSYRGTLTLWSKKPLCASCTHVVHTQLRAALPNAELVVRVDDES